MDELLLNNNDGPVRGGSPIEVYIQDGTYDALVIRFMLKVKKKRLFQIIETDLSDHNARRIELDAIPGQPTLTLKGRVYHGLDVIIMLLEEAYRNPTLFITDNYEEKAVHRMMIDRVQNVWMPWVGMLNSEDKEQAKAAEILLINVLTDITPSCIDRWSFTGKKFILLDVYMVPFLYKLDLAGFDWKKVPSAFIQYAQRMFRSFDFADSLSMTDLKLSRQILDGPREPVDR